jgi:RNA recognition motif-containing protein
LNPIDGVLNSSLVVSLHTHRNNVIHVISFSHSVYVGQVDYLTTPEELLSHFEACGTVERVTIVCDKMTGRPKGAWKF